ncbi:EPB41L4A [Branchiostoma lanceolatum]|uniref:EPB41L4A protein n=1 Tax=Branchiostoma lanceolatum TaxID=7740 RepID=A0A8J9ZDS4_BRALA|nr:EPB41L4A [Branchiostoma lanceolatum]
MDLCGCLGGDKAIQVLIHLLDNTKMVLTRERDGVKKSSKGQVLLDLVFKKLHLLEKDFFGLRYQDSQGQTHWLEPTKPISKQMETDPPYRLYFGVKFYAEDPCRLHQEITRYQFFLQVKQDILQGRLPCQANEAAHLAAYAVQSELGDFDPRKHTGNYVSEFRFIPNQTEEMEKLIANIHRTLVGQVPSEAELNFLSLGRVLEMYGVDLHQVMGDDHVQYYLGLMPRGVVVYKNKTKVGMYFWPRITKILFKERQFFLRVRTKDNDEITYTFELSNKAACKHLWKCCVEHHAFFRLNEVSEVPGANKVISFQSQFRYSGRTAKQAQQDSDAMQQPEPYVERAPSKRYDKRNDANGEAYKVENPADVTMPTSPDGVTMVMAPEPVSSGKQYANGTAPGSAVSARSLPWEQRDETQGGLFTSGGSPRSTRSVASSKKFPRYPKSGSDSEGPHRRRHHRARSSGMSSGDDTDAPRRRRRSRGRSGQSSGSESEANRRHRKHRSRYSQEMVDTSAQWEEIRKQQEGQEVPAGQGVQAAEIKNLKKRHESPHRRKHRSRSRSPDKRREELWKHIQKDPIETSGMTEDQLKDITYKEVDLPKLKQSPGYRRRRPRSIGRSDQETPQQSDVELKMVPALPITHGYQSGNESVRSNPAFPPHDDQPPPPYTPPQHSTPRKNPEGRRTGNNDHRPISLPTEVLLKMQQTGYPGLSDHLVNGEDMSRSSTVLEADLRGEGPASMRGMNKSSTVYDGDSRRDSPASMRVVLRRGGGGREMPGWDPISS